MKTTWPAVVVALLVAACSTSGQRTTLETVPRVELDRYAGTWHEIARMPRTITEAPIFSA